MSRYISPTGEKRVDLGPVSKGERKRLRKAVRTTSRRREVVACLGCGQSSREDICPDCVAMAETDTHEEIPT